jgi:hypothetical protein
MKTKLHYWGTIFLLFSSITLNAQLLFKNSSQTLDITGFTFAIGDVNNDGFPDFYVGNYIGKLLINNKDSTFSNGQSFGHSGITRQVALGDLDGDGDLDIFVVNDASYDNSTYASGYPNEVWFNDGKGNFTNSGQALGNEPSNGVKLIDIDGDGDLDAFVANYHPADDPTYSKFKPDEVWLNDGKGFFTLSQKLGYGMQIPQLADLNKDGYIDALVQDTIWFNDGKGKFIKSNKTIGSNSFRVEFGDIDNDGDLDAVIGNWGSPAQIWLNDGSCNFSNTGQQLGSAKVNNIQVLDIDGDGDLDIFMDNYGGACKLWINNGGKQGGKIGTFSDSGLSLPSGFGMLCDINKDGKQDAIISNKVWINKYVSPNISGITDNLFNDNFRLYPNPTNGILNLYLGENKPQNVKIEINSLTGNKLYSNILHDINILDVNLQQYPQGIYLAKVIIDENKIYTQKFTLIK